MTILDDLPPAFLAEVKERAFMLGVFHALIWLAAYSAKMEAAMKRDDNGA